MIWIIVASIAVSLSALASLWGTVEDRRDLATENPTLDTLVSHTGITDRNVFIELLGEPNELNRFEVPLSRLHDLPRAIWHRYFDNQWVDMMCVVFSVTAPVVWFGWPILAIILLSTAAMIQVFGYSVAAISFYRSDVWRDTDINAETEDNEPKN